MRSLRMLIVALTFGWAQIAPPSVFASGPSNVPTVADRDKDPEQYYRDIGRDDIAAKYSARSDSQTAGIALVVVGALLLPLSFLAFGAENFDNETPDDTGAFLLLGIGALVLGGGSIWSPYQTIRFRQKSIRCWSRKRPRGGLRILDCNSDSDEILLF